MAGLFDLLIDCIQKKELKELFEKEKKGLLNDNYLADYYLLREDYYDRKMPHNAKEAKRNEKKERASGRMYLEYSKKAQIAA